jgi:DNA-binding transcriptional ArsR family regulator
MEETMSEERREILKMLAEGKITVNEAEKLLAALGEQAQPKRADGADDETPAVGKKRPKYLRITVQPKGTHGSTKNPVNIKVPLFLVKTGLKFSSALPEHAREKIERALGEKNIDLGKLDGAAIDELAAGLSELSIDVDDDDEHVRIFCE